MGNQPLWKTICWICIIPKHVEKTWGWSTSVTARSSTGPLFVGNIAASDSLVSDVSVIFNQNMRQSLGEGYHKSHVHGDTPLEKKPEVVNRKHQNHGPFRRHQFFSKKHRILGFSCTVPCLGSGRVYLQNHFKINFRSNRNHCSQNTYTRIWENH